MSITEEGTGPSNEPTASLNPDKPSSAQAAAKQPGQGLPGLAAFGQMQGYQPLGSQPQNAAEAAQPEAVPELIPAEPVVPHTEIPETSYPATPQNGTDPLVTEIDPFAAETDHPVPDYLTNTPAVEDVAAPTEEAPSLMDDIQSYMNEPAAFDDAQFQPGPESPEAVAVHQPEVIDQAAIEPAAIEPAAIEPAGIEPAAIEAAAIEPATVEPAGHPNTIESGALQTFEATYDQHPEIPLGAFEQPGELQPDDQPFMEPQPEQPPQPHHAPAGDADFMGGEAQAEPEVAKGGRGRKVLMAASGLVGVLALGGALAFAYKIGGDSDIAKAGKPPLIQADSRPVKVAPDKPGGKEFPHTNKKIYERLGGDASEEVVKIKPRQEDIAAAATAAVGTPGAAQPAQPNAAVPGGPRKVKTLTVRPDGTIEAANPAPAAAPPPGVVTANDGTVSMQFPRQQAAVPGAQPQVPAAAPTQAAAPQAQPVVPAIPQPAAQPAAATPPPAPQQQAAVAPATAAPPPVQKPQAPAAPRQAAAQPAAAAATGSYVVQVAARKSQTDALAAFADIQQKYPRLLSGYRPIIKRADLGNKGVWYRLNVGPVESKKVASSLCGQLKSAGMRSCIVRAQ